jgi:ABC-2 type transport system permease protein
MTTIDGLGNRIFEFKATQKFCTSLGINLRQYPVLVELFRTLGDRLEFMNMTVALHKVVGFQVFISLIISLIALARPSLKGYFLICLGCSMLLLLLMLLQDATQSLMDPDEATILAHLPIGGATYITAKLTHLLVIVGIIVPSLNLIPALAGLYLREARWFYPLTHLTAAYLAGLFVAFLVCGIYGWMFLFISPAKLKNAALWLQLIIPLAPIVLINFVRVSPKSELMAPIFAKLLDSSWMPWRWFVAVALLGHSEHARFAAWEALSACLVTGIMIVFGLRAFRADYLIKVSNLIHGNVKSAVRSSKTSRLSTLVRNIARAPSGYGAFSFVSIMCRRDWNFRRQVLPWSASYGLMGLGAAIAGLRISPFGSAGGKVAGFSPAHLFPHFLGMVLVFVCFMLSFTAEPKGASVFVTLPMKNLSPFAKGIYMSLWTYIVALPHLFLLGPCMWFWGLPHGALYILYSSLLVSFYLALAFLFFDGFPFVNPMKPASAMEMQIPMLASMLLIAIIGVIQYLVFRIPALVLGAAALLAILNLIAIPITLRNIERKARNSLQILGFGPQSLFKEVE